MKSIIQKYYAGIKKKDLVEKIHPNILIEDNCKSIGGEKHCCITNVSKDIKKTIKSIIVEEFKGIDSIEI